MKLADVVKGVTKVHGEGYAFEASSFDPMIERIPSGIFQFDLALAGGIPRGKLTTLYGVESAGKTTMAIVLAAAEQRLHPKVKVAFIDIEHAFDPQWGQRLGLDLARTVVFQPPTAENAIDMLDQIVEATDASIVILDSLAAMITSTEAANSADKMAVGTNSLIIGKLTRKLTYKTSVMAAKGHYPTIIAINQMRYAIGVIHGDPEKQPGGQAPKHSAALILRIGGAPVKDKAVHDTLPARRKITFSVKKYKVPIHQTHFDFEMNLIPVNGNGVGFVDWWSTAQRYMKEFGMIQQLPNKKWSFVGEEFDTLKAIREALDADIGLRLKCEQDVIQRAVENDWKVETNA